MGQTDVVEEPDFYKICHVYRSVNGSGVDIMWISNPTQNHLDSKLW